METKRNNVGPKDLHVPINWLPNEDSFLCWASLNAICDSALEKRS